jgi:superfamily I DNA and RNA helicase
LNLNTTKERLRSDPAASALIDLIEKNESSLGLADSNVYYKFPIYKDNEDIITAKLIIVAPERGVIVISTTITDDPDDDEAIQAADDELDTVYGQLHARFTKQKSLRRDKKNLSFSLEPMIFAPYLSIAPKNDVETDLVMDRAGFSDFLNARAASRIDPETVREICSVIEGAKGLVVPRPRAVVGLPQSARAAQVNALEAEIRSFDQDQKHGYMEVLQGPQRIRGLAGSGKTVVLAMKAAITHLQNPHATIAYTFYTRSLYQHVRRLITRFYRQYDDRDPNWEKLQVIHAWGGRTKAGLYYNACLDHGVSPLKYSQVSTYSNPFDAACLDLIEKAKEIKPTYDYVLVDEGQDFPASFLRLSLDLAHDHRFVYAYDELQTIFQSETPSVESIFGPGFKLDEDVILRKCYRNPREVLVCAHATGFGIYGERIVQMLENKGHWSDLGYEVLSGDFDEGKAIDIQRPENNSPSSISKQNSIDKIITCTAHDSPDEEISDVAGRIETDIKVQGLHPEDVVVMCVDDMLARDYFKALSSKLNKVDISCNNLFGDSFGSDVFTREKSVTLTTVHRAKGNEGYSVYIVGVDALFKRPTVRTRNMIFTAMTRSKAWLHICGTGSAAEVFEAELSQAKRNFPHLRFKYPSESQLKIMKRDLSETVQQRLERALEEVADDISEEDFKKIIGRLASRRKKKFR